jgi:hypothetical protein
MHGAATAATQDMQLGYDRQSAFDSALLYLTKYGEHLTKLELAEFHRGLLRPPCEHLQYLALGGRISMQLGMGHGQPGVLHGLTKLTHLELRGNLQDVAGGAVVDNLSSLVHLQHLDLNPAYRWVGGLSDATLRCLQQLTYLQVSCLSSENLLQLGGLTNLRGLCLHVEHVVNFEDIAVGPSSVPGLAFPTCLQKLVLASRVEAGLLSLLPANLQELQVLCGVEGPAEGPGSLLSCIARLQHLTVLRLHPDDTVLPPSGPAYSALTASSNLVNFDVSYFRWPEGAWKYVFPAGRRLPHLKCLIFQACWPAWRDSELTSLVSCCPGLCDVDTLSLLPGQHVSELRKLTALTRLRVNYATVDSASFAECMVGLAVVTQLRSLQVRHVRQVNQSAPVAALLPLTSLTALSALEIEWYPPVEDEYGPLQFTDTNVRT